MKLAIVHDYLTQRGGAERVVLELHRRFPDAPIYTSLYDAQGTYPEFATADIHTSFLQRLPARRDFRSLLPLFAAAFEGLELKGFDVVMSSSSGWAHALRTPGARHVCYCYTPARWLYDTAGYLGEAGAPRWARPLLPPTLAALRRWDRRAARRPDEYVAISHVVADRISRIYGRESRVIYPPVDTARFRESDDPVVVDEPFFLAIARFLPYKRIDLVVRACTELGLRLVVVGAGPEYAALRALAGPTVEFRHNVPDRELTALMRSCEAVVQAGVEDFGLVPLEANAAGRPVVAFAGGGALETVVGGETGVLFRQQSVESLAGALEAVRSTEWKPERLRAHAERFGVPAFLAQLESVLTVPAEQPATIDLRQSFLELNSV